MEEAAFERHEYEQQKDVPFAWAKIRVTMEHSRIGYIIDHDNDAARIEDARGISSTEISNEGFIVHLETPRRHAYYAVHITLPNSHDYLSTRTIVERKHKDRVIVKMQSFGSGEGTVWRDFDIAIYEIEALNPMTGETYPWR